VSKKLFYTVRNYQGEALMGTESENEALDFFDKQNFARIFVSVWEGEGEDIYQTVEPINVTSLVLRAQAREIQEVRKVFNGK
jgi:hypothetical protein